jgi:ArsR family transcriptional regulator
VRPEREFASGHVPGAVNVPLAHLAERLSGLPRDAPIVAYCRGPYCVMAAAAVHQLRAAGFPAARLQVGYPDWLTASGAAPAADRTRRN